MNYKITFFKLEKENDEKGKSFVKSTQFLGSVIVDDNGTSKDFTLLAKAFRVAAPVCALADKVKVEEL